MSYVCFSFLMMLVVVCESRGATL